MAELPPCFVNEVTEPVKVISTRPIRPKDESCASEVHQFSILDQIRSHFSCSHSYPWHFVYVLLPELCALKARMAWLNQDEQLNMPAEFMGAAADYQTHVWLPNRDLQFEFDSLEYIIMFLWEGRRRRIYLLHSVYSV